ncbi:hypothetical protein GPECTOR_197g341 [Gonium pectorale]|uniref:Isopenicillin N synthase-like Fe(2+) 2OG dioxygenase domain-containing protein n=1 Tax=Gonium pectorale TaxID=33097 RepID=A0A150FX30_GONPE|nr:hypothetical protein GPECTOR_197g341 [Gonium pectorale]|eukprot:KXZ42137.1 hypothetical protein GPECTOR_197g341 [Gonium pectorale]
MAHLIPSTSAPSAASRYYGWLLSLLDPPGRLPWLPGLGVRLGDDTPAEAEHDGASGDSGGDYNADGGPGERDGAVEAGEGAAGPPGATASPPPGRSDGDDDGGGYRPHRRSRHHHAVGSDVLRVYQYYRPASQPPPGLRHPATGLHADMGLLTVAPPASLPGLTCLAPDGSAFLDVESSLPNRQCFVVFAVEFLLCRTGIHYMVFSRENGGCHL